LHVPGRTPASTARALAFARNGRARFLSELAQFIRMPTVSAQPRHAPDLERAARWLARHLSRIGLARVRVVPTARHPIVYGEWLGAPGRPTLLIYGHYDVQPPDPLRDWRTPPFEPTLRGLDLHARGACDDKGQLFTHLKALESYLRTGALPLNVKCLFEGEEEIGSPHLAAFVQRHRDVLSADGAVMSDTRMLGPGRPAISYAERGALYFDLEVQGGLRDVHSGSFGGALHNPLQALTEILAGLHDAEGRIAIPGLYDDVRRVSVTERRNMARRGPRDEAILADAGATHGWGEPGYSLYERLTIRPALTFNGLAGGYQGSGSKGIIPARATAKLSLRLVPDQDPRRIERLVRRHIVRVTPPTVRCRVRTLSATAPAILNTDHPALRAAARAYARGFGAAPVLIRSGGTIPILSVFQQVLGIPTVLMGFALPDDGMHAPNEKFHLPNFFKGIDTSIWFMREFAVLGCRAQAP
jgi:acetylornithine deacetylase/succinyl-diaminopimelate desuccinylase-like protein